MLITTWSPQFAFFHNPYEWGTFTQDLQRFARLIKGTLEAPPQSLITNPTVDDVRALMRGAQFVAVDIETGAESPQRPWTGKDPTRARLKTIALGTPTHAIAHYWEGGRAVEREIAKVLQDPKIPKVFHNGYWFDLRVMERYGLSVNNVEDTRDARRSLSATSPLSLRFLGSIYTDFEAWKEDDSGDSKGLVFTPDREKLLRYNALDTIVTARVWEKMRAELGADSRILALYRMHQELSQIAAEMHTTGFPVDRLMRTYISWGLHREYQEKRRDLLALVNKPAFRGTPFDMRSLIFAKYAKSGISGFNLPDPIDPRMYTEKGAISVDSDALMLLLVQPSCPPELAPIVEAYWAMTSLQKARNTFVASDLVSMAIGDDGRLRPGWNSCGTDTGRWSCSEPNIMNLEQYIRAMYTAPPGHQLVHADYSQLELRVMATVAPDEELQRRLDAGDVYTADAIDWFQLPPGTNVKKLKPAARKAAKIIHLGAQYGAGTDTIWLQALPEDRKMKHHLCAALHKSFKKTYSQTVDYWFAEQERVRKTGYSESRIMRRRRVYPREPGLTEIANYPIQSTASDVANIAMVELHRRLREEAPNSKLIVQLHDAFDVVAPDNEVETVERLMAEVMEKPHTIDGRELRVPVEIKRGTSWDQV